VCDAHIKAVIDKVQISLFILLIFACSYLIVVGRVVEKILLLLREIRILGRIGGMQTAQENRKELVMMMMMMMMMMKIIH